ncbi:MAG: type II toxin-antitoxin system mRNA interferase toxin, RelE/StbE family [Candidatus Peregrinibacteria bacterium]|nr:type II toxin-antitoxin system mRNA interferase toxin, RelE/StbE family [Candidatus Peregrinibacteria bacterium]
MILKLHKQFNKSYEKLTPKLKQKADFVMQCFRLNPLDPSLQNHPLHGEMSGKRAISVTGDVRIIFEEHDDYILVIMLDIGTHNQVY